MAFLPELLFPVTVFKLPSNPHYDRPALHGAIEGDKTFLVLGSACNRSFQGVEQNVKKIVCPIFKEILKK